MLYDGTIVNSSEEVVAYLSVAIAALAWRGRDSRQSRNGAVGAVTEGRPTAS
jgi:hypothetical protein